MSYPSPTSEEHVKELLKRKEFAQYRYDPDYNYRKVTDQAPLAGLNPTTYQLFDKNFMNPDTKTQSLLLKYDTGTGKTLSAIMIAMEFTKMYKSIYRAKREKMSLAGNVNITELDRTTPTIFVIGYSATKTAFYRDLLKYPEFGFITYTERDELRRLESLARKGASEVDVQKAHDYKKKIKKSITTKVKGGFFRFIGYKKLVNRLFTSKDIDLTNLENNVKRDSSLTLEELIYKYVEEGKIQVNVQFLELFRDSLIICDEVHNIYNMNMKNNFGVAIMYLVNYHTNLKSLFLTATPINNNPREVIDILDLLLPKEKRVKYTDIFDERNQITQAGLKKLGELVVGHISFVQDIDPTSFPKRIINGETITTKDGETIPYIKFIRCPISEYHRDAFLILQKEGFATATVLDQEDIDDISGGLCESDIASVKGAAEDVQADVAAEDVPADDQVDEPIDVSVDGLVDRRDDTSGGVNKAVTKILPINRLKIPPDGTTIYDMVFPNPSNPSKPLYRSSNTKIQILDATQKERDKFGINITKGVPTGEFLDIDNIGKYSSKYYHLLTNIISILSKQVSDWKKDKHHSLIEHGQKMMIYHRRVSMSGVKLIGELLNQNGFISEYSNPTNTTRCSVCGGLMSKHERHVKEENIEQHDFKPCRFVIVHSDIDERVWQQSLELFNSSENAFGEYAKIFIGSKKIQEGFEVKCVQHLHIVGMPVDISSLLQVFGRVSRKGSHEFLPSEYNRVFVNIYVTAWEKTMPVKMLSPDEQRYLDKLNNYIEIQKIEKTFHENAIDATIHRDRIMPKSLLEVYFPSGQKKDPVNSIGNLYFEPKMEMPFIPLDKLDLRTFNAYGHFEDEISTILYIIKRLFLETPAWTYKDLWESVRKPPFNLEVNPNMFLENNFIIALNKLLVHDNIMKDETDAENIVELLRNVNEKHIIIDNVKYVIYQYDEYYIRMPVDASGNVLHDINSFLTPPKQSNDIVVPLLDFTSSTRSTYQYDMKRKTFKSRVAKGEDISDLLLHFNSEFFIGVISEAISYYVRGEIKEKAAGKGGDDKAMFDAVLKYFNDYGCILSAGYIIKYKTTAKQFTNKKIINVNSSGLPSLKINHRTPLGFLTKTSVRLYDHPNWIEVSKSSLNIITNFVEHGPFVGQIEQLGTSIKFKYRKPFKDKSGVSDSRTLERGSACETKNKTIVKENLKELHLKSQDGVIREYCDAIYKKLLLLEKNERMKDSKFKYFYMFFDEMPN